MTNGLRFLLRRIGRAPIKLAGAAAKVLSSNAVDHPFITLFCVISLVTLLTVNIRSIRFETDITNLADESSQAARDIERAARDFSVGDPLRLMLLGDATDPSVLQRASVIAGELRRIQNVIRVITPFDANYLFLEGLSVVPRPVLEGIPDTEEAAMIFFNNLAKSYTSRHMISKTADAILFDLYVRGGIGSRGKAAISEIEQTLDRSWGSGDYYLVGEVFLGFSVDRTVLRDAKVLFPVSVGIFILVVLLSFRSLIALLVIGSTVMATVSSTLGFMAWRGTALTIVSVTLPVLLVALGSADGIHVFCRYREMLGSEANKKIALKKAMHSLAAPIVMTSVTTASGFAALMASSVIPVRDFGLYSVFGILFAMFYSLSAIPAILSIVSIPQRARSGTKRRVTLTRLLESVAVFGQEHWKVVLVVGFSIATASGVGIMRLQFESNLARYFRKGSDVSQGIREYEKRFGGSSMLMIIVDSGNEGGTLQPAFMNILREVHRRVDSYPLLTRTSSFVSFLDSVTPDGIPGTAAALVQKNLGVIGLHGYLSRDGMRKAALHTQIYSAEAADVSRTLSRLEEELREIVPPGIDVTIAGTPKVVEFHMREFASSQSRSIMLSGGAVWFLVLFLFGSIGIGTLAMVPLCLAVLINFGIMGIAGIPLDAATILIASISIGVGADYSIHLLERITGVERHTRGSLEVFTDSIKSVGEAIVINTLTLFAGFAVFVFSSFLTIAYFGVLTAMTLAVSCCAALIIVPAFLAAFSGRQASHFKSTD